MGSKFQVTTKDKLGPLTAMMYALSGNACVSFEGDLSGSDLFNIKGAFDSETQILKRSTYWPKQDFVVVPLESNTIPLIFERAATFNT